MKRLKLLFTDLLDIISKKSAIKFRISSFHLSRIQVMSLSFRPLVFNHPQLRGEALLLCSDLSEFLRATLCWRTLQVQRVLQHAPLLFVPLSAHLCKILPCLLKAPLCQRTTPSNSLVPSSQGLGSTTLPRAAPGR